MRWSVQPSRAAFKKPWRAPTHTDCHDVNAGSAPHSEQRRAGQEEESTIVTLWLCFHFFFVSFIFLQRKLKTHFSDSDNSWIGCRFGRFHQPEPEFPWAEDGVWKKKKKRAVVRLHPHHRCQQQQQQQQRTNSLSHREAALSKTAVEAAFCFLFFCLKFVKLFECRRPANKQTHRLWT